MSVLKRDNTKGQQIRRYRFRPTRLLFVVVIVIGLVGLPSAYFAQARTRLQPGDVVSVAVQHGDTLWGIASEYAPPGADVRVVVERIRAYNELQSALLQPGQILEIPTR